MVKIFYIQQGLLETEKTVNSIEKKKDFLRNVDRSDINDGTRLSDKFWQIACIKYDDVKFGRLFKSFLTLHFSKNSAKNFKKFPQNFPRKING